MLAIRIMGSVTARSKITRKCVGALIALVCYYRKREQGRESTGVKTNQDLFLFLFLLLFLFHLFLPLLYLLSDLYVTKT
jgi:hypothetical protein